MEFTDQLELLPHYVAIVILVAVVLGGIRLAVGDVAVWINVLCVVGLVLAYPTVARALGFAPDAWERR